MSSSCYSGYDDRSFDFDDDSSFDSGYEKSFETDCNVATRKLNFDTVASAEFPTGPVAGESTGTANGDRYSRSFSGSTNSNYSGPQAQFLGLLDTSSNHSTRNGRTLVEHVISKATTRKTLGDVDFNPQLGVQTSTPTKNSNSDNNSSSGEQSNEPRPKRKYAVGKNRVTRSRSPMQVIRIKKFRRMKANDRERNRMHTLNDALEKLRVTLPSLPEETKLTKIEILRFAHNYIFALEQVLESGGSINLDLEKLQNFTLSGERITKELFEALFVNPQPYSFMSVGMGVGVGVGMRMGTSGAVGYGRMPYTHAYAPIQTPASATGAGHFPQAPDYASERSQHQASTMQQAYHQSYNHVDGRSYQKHPTYQHQYSRHATSFSNYDFYDSMRYYKQQQLTNQHNQEPLSSSAIDSTIEFPSNFSHDRYKLFRGTFEAAANLADGNSNSNSQSNTNNDRMPAVRSSRLEIVKCKTYDNMERFKFPSEHLGYMPSSKLESKDESLTVTRLPNGVTASTSEDCLSLTAPQLHQNSSFYSQTPPWKDYNEQFANTNHDFETFSPV